jgi:hypothetical protein
LKDALAARDSLGESATGLDEIISRLQGVASDLQAVRQQKSH